MYAASGAGISKLVHKCLAVVPDDFSPWEGPHCGAVGMPRDATLQASVPDSPPAPAIHDVAFGLAIAVAHVGPGLLFKVRI
eukprot:354859-Chlamydomonas_euryale.AAC.8